MRRVLRNLLEELLNSAIPTWLIRRHARGQTLILAYHNIVPPAAPPRGDLSLHLSSAAFAQQLELIANSCDVIPLAAALEPARSRRPRIAITFDDAYRGAVTLGTRELVKRRLPATIFVAPAFVGGGAFWWDELPPTGTSMPAVDRTFALQRLQGKDHAIRGWADAHLIPTVPAESALRGASESELADAIGSGLVTLGSHSWSHPNLATLPEPDLAEELTRPLDWLRSRFQAVVPWLSYPYGRSSPLVEHVARATGYVAGLRIEGGWVRHPERRPYEIPRLNVPAGISGPGFSLRTAAFVTAR